eukprot:5615822-Pyramimonas_sp.AAC.1
MSFLIPSRVQAVDVRSLPWVFGLKNSYQRSANGLPAPCRSVRLAGSARISLGRQPAQVPVRPRPRLSCHAEL